MANDNPVLHVRTSVNDGSKYGRGESYTMFQWDDTKTPDENLLLLNQSLASMLHYTPYDLRILTQNQMEQLADDTLEELGEKFTANPRGPKPVIKR